MASYQFKEYNEETETFETFYERLEQFLILEEAGDEKKKAYLLTLMGSKTYGVLKNLCSPILPKNKTFDDLIDILKRHFSPKRSIVVERFIFFKRMQLKEESISDYLVEIKRLASSCNFGNFLEDSLRDKMVCGLYNAKIQNRILSEGDISLAKVIEIALSMEAAEKNTKLFHLEQGEDCVDKLRIERKVESNFQNGKCKHCGKPHKEPCRFKEAICFKCNKKGHIASICWSSRRNLRQHQNQPGNIHQIGDQEEEEEYVQKIISVTIPEYKINFASSDPPYLMELKVEGNFIKFEMDTGSGLTLISEKDFKNSLQHLKLEKASIIVRTYDGTVVPILGKINVKVECQDITYKLRALVVKGEKRALMGREWINRLKLGCFAVKHMPVEITIEEILKENQALFVETTEPIKGFTFSVNMCDVNPIFHKARPVPFAIRPAVTEALDKMVAKGYLCEVASSKWATPVVVVPKKNKEIRICCDFKVTLNKYLDTAAYPLPTQQDLFSTLAKGKYFSKLDLRNAYLQLEVDPGTRPLLTINTHKGLFRFKRMPFGLANAPSYFQSVMDRVLSGIGGVICYIDDVLIATASIEEHLALLKTIFARLAKYNIKLKKEKCLFLQKEIEYLGHLVTGEGIRPLDHKECGEAIDKCKNSITSERVLVPYDATLPLCLATDASQIGVGAVLSHIIEGQERPIMFASRTLSVAEQNYSQIEKEALAIIYGVTKFHQFIYGRKFILITDHKPLVTILGSRSGIPTLSTSRLQRWALILSAYTYDIKFRRTQDHGNADLLSRFPVGCEEIPRLNNVYALSFVEELPITAEEIATETEKDEVLSLAKFYTQQGWPEKVADHLRPYFQRKLELTVDGECLVWGMRVVIPPSLRIKMLNCLHETHSGMNKMKAVARSHFWWPNLDTQIEFLVNKCRSCQQSQDGPNKGKWQPWKWSTRPWQRIHIDFANKENINLLIVVDSHSKWIEAIPMRETTTRKTIEQLRRLFSSYGLPEELVSDNGPQFTGSEMKGFLEGNGIKQTLIPAYHPQSNGLAERAVRTIKTALDKNKRKIGDTIQDTLSKVLLAYRSTPHVTTGKTPSELFIGRALRTRVSLIHPSLASRVRDQQARQMKYDRRTHLEEFQIDDLVWCKNFRGGDKWIPGKIVGKKGTRVYTILIHGQVKAYHRDQIRKRWRNGEEDESGDGERQPEHSRGAGPNAIISEVVRDRGYVESMSPGLTSQRSDQDSEVQSDTDDGKSLEPLPSLDPEALKEEGPVLRRNPPRARRLPVRFEERRWLRCEYNHNLKIPWTKYIPNITESYNDTVHTITGFTPRFLYYGIQPQYIEHDTETHTPIEKARKLTIERTIKSHEHSKQLYDIKHPEPIFKEGDQDANLKKKWDKMASYQFKEYNEETETFETFYERLEQFLILEEAGDEKKKAYLLTLMGSKTYGVLKNLCSPILPKNKTFDDLIDILKRHFSPKRSIVVERFIFFKRMQLKEESISDYLVEIKRLASSCNFGNFLEDSLRDKMVCGLYNAKIQNRILSEGDISLAKVIEIALSMEAAEKNTKLFHLEQGEDCVDKLRIERKVESNFQNGKCKHCGKPHKEPCRFKEAICFKCNKKGHIASICWSSRRNLRQHQNQPGNIHQIGDQEEEEEYVQKIISVTIPEYKINFASSDPPYLMELKVEGNFIKFEMDTGSGLTLISEKDFKNSLQHLKLEKASIIVRTYDGTVVPILGKINVKVECQDITYKLRALVVKGEKRALMGREWINRLKLGCFAVKHMPVEITIEEILKENQALFVETTEPIKGFTFSVNMCDVNPIFHKARPVPFAIRPAVTEALDKMVAKGYLCEVASSKWATPVVVVPKKNKEIRICCDFKVTLNKYLDTAAYPLPTQQDLFSTLAKGKYFSKLDLRNAYLQLEVDPGTRPLLTINTHKGLFRFKRMPFGLANAPSYFQSVMDRVLSGIGGVICYIDDVLIATASIEEHLALLKTIFARLAKYNIKLKKEKCLFLQKEIEYLGHLVTGEGIRPLDHKVQAIQKAKMPTNISDLRSFLGLVNFYGKFIPNLPELLKPLHELLHKKRPWVWTKECGEAIDKCKNSITSERVLVPYDTTLPLCLATDASQIGVGAVLSHIIEGQERPIMFASRTLSEAEQNYSQIEKEALAIIYGVTKFHQFIYGRKFILITDHKPLVTILGPRSGIPTLSTSRLQRWALILSAYTYDIKFRRTQDHGNADLLSRFPVGCEEIPRLINVYALSFVEELPITAEEIATETEKDEVLSLAKFYTQQGWPEKVADHLRPYFQRKLELTVDGECLVWGMRVVIPPSLRIKMLNCLHETHSGMNKMKVVARSHFWWPNLDTQIEFLVNKCRSCQQSQDGPNKGKWQPWKWSTRPWQRIHIDFANKENINLLIVVDSHSKWIEAIPMRETTTRKTIEQLRRLFSSYGLPEELVSDNGPQFTGSEMKGFLEGNGIKQTLIPAYHPQSNGLAERAVRTIKTALDKNKRKIGDTIQDTLSKVLLAYRSTPHVTTGKTPSELFIGRALRTRVSLIHPSLASRVRDQQARQMKYDRRTHLEEFQIDDLVWCKNFRGGDKWIPGKIVGKKGTRVYTILIHGQVKAYHRDQIRKRWRNGEEDESGDGERQPEHSRGAGPNAIISEVVRDRGYVESMSPGLASQRSDQDSEVQSDTDDGKSLEPLPSLDPEALKEEGPVLRRNPPRARRLPVRFEERRCLSTTAASGKSHDTSQSTTSDSGQSHDTSLSTTADSGRSHEPVSVLHQTQVKVTTPVSVLQQPQVKATTPVSVLQQPQVKATTPVSVLQQTQVKATTPVSVLQQTQVKATTPVLVLQQPQVEVTNQSQYYSRLRSKSRHQSQYYSRLRSKSRTSLSTLADSGRSHDTSLNTLADS
ncbi:hypothetical protein LAZ67_23001442, partial [Cordylochernes scorpioides]